MSGIWDFVKRHRGKIVAGAVVAGGAFVIQQAWQNPSLQFFSSRWNRDREFIRNQLKVSENYVIFAFILSIYLYTSVFFFGFGILSCFISI